MTRHDDVPKPLVRYVHDNALRVRLLAANELAESVAARHKVSDQLATLAWHWTHQHSAHAAEHVLHITSNMADAPLDLHYVNAAHAGRYRLYERTAADAPRRVLLFDIDLRIDARFDMLLQHAGTALLLECSHAGDAPVRWTHWCGGGPLQADLQRVVRADYDAAVRDKPLQQILQAYRDHVPSVGFVFAHSTQRMLSVPELGVGDSGLYVAESMRDERVLGVFDVQVVGTAVAVAPRLWRTRDDPAAAQWFSQHNVHYLYERALTSLTVQTPPPSEARSLNVRWYVCPVPPSVANGWPHTLTEVQSWRDDHRAIGYLDMPLRQPSSLSVTLDTQACIYALAGLAQDRVYTREELKLARFTGASLVLLAFEEHEPRDPWPVRYTSDTQVDALPFLGGAGEGEASVQAQVRLLRARHATLDKLLVPLGATTMWVAPSSTAASDGSRIVPDLSLGRLTMQHRDDALQSPLAYVNVGGRVRVRLLRHAALVNFTEDAPPPVVQSTAPTSKRLRALGQLIAGADDLAMRADDARRLVRRDAQSPLAHAVDCQVRAELSALMALWYVAGLRGGVPERWYEGATLLSLLASLARAPESVDVVDVQSDGSARVQPSLERAVLAPMRIELPLFDGETRVLDEYGARTLHALALVYGDRLLLREWTRPFSGVRLWPTYNVVQERELWIVRSDNASALVSLLQTGGSRIGDKNDDNDVCSISAARVHKPLAQKSGADDWPSTPTQAVLAILTQYWPDGDAANERFLLVGNTDAQQLGHDANNVTLGPLLQRGILASAERTPLQTRADLARERIQRLTAVALAWRNGSHADDAQDDTRERLRTVAAALWGTDAPGNKTRDTQEYRELLLVLRIVFRTYSRACRTALLRPADALDALDKTERVMASVNRGLAALVARLEASAKEHAEATAKSVALANTKRVRDAEYELAWRNGPGRVIVAHYETAVGGLAATLRAALRGELARVARLQPHTHWGVAGRQRYEAALASYRRQLQRALDAVVQYDEENQRLLLASVDAFMAEGRPPMPRHEAFGDARLKHILALLDEQIRAELLPALERSRLSTTTLQQRYRDKLNELANDAELWRDLPTAEQTAVFERESDAAVAQIVEQLHARRAPTAVVPPPAVVAVEPPVAVERNQLLEQLDTQPERYARSLSDKSVAALVRIGEELARSFAAIAARDDRLRAQMPLHWSQLMHNAYWTIDTPAQHTILAYITRFLDAYQATDAGERVQRASARLSAVWFATDDPPLAARYEALRLAREPYEQWLFDAHGELAAIAVTASLHPRVVRAYAIAADWRRRWLAESERSDVLFRVRSMLAFYREVDRTLGGGGRRSFLLEYQHAASVAWRTNFYIGNDLADAGDAVRRLVDDMQRVRVDLFSATTQRSLDAQADVRRVRMQASAEALYDAIDAVQAPHTDMLFTHTRPPLGAVNTPLALFLRASKADYEEPLAATDARLAWVRTVESTQSGVALELAQAKLALFAYARQHLGVLAQQRAARIASDVAEYVMRNRDELLRRGWVTSRQPALSAAQFLLAPLGSSSGARPLLDQHLAGMRSGLVDSRGASSPLRSTVFEQLFVGETALFGARALPQLRPNTTDQEQYARALEAQLVLERALLADMFAQLKDDGTRLLVDALCGERPLFWLQPSTTSDQRVYVPSALLWRYAVQATERVALAHHTGAPLQARDNLLATLTRQFGAHAARTPTTVTVPRALVLLQRARALLARDDDTGSCTFLDNSALATVDAAGSTNVPEALIVERTLFTDWYDAWMGVMDAAQTRQQHRTDAPALGMPVRLELFRDNNLWASADTAASTLLAPLQWPEAITLADEFASALVQIARRQAQLVDQHVAHGTGDAVTRALTDTERRSAQALHRRVDRAREELIRLVALVDAAARFNEALRVSDNTNTEHAYIIQRTYLVRSEYTAHLHANRYQLQPNVGGSQYRPVPPTEMFNEADRALIAEAAFARTLARLSEERARLNALRVSAEQVASERIELANHVAAQVAVVTASGVDDAAKVALSPTDVLSLARAVAQRDELAAELARLQAVGVRAAQYAAEKRTLSQQIAELRTALGPALASTVEQHTTPERIKLALADRALEKLRKERERLQVLVDRQRQFGDAAASLAGVVSTLSSAVPELNDLV